MHKDRMKMYEITNVSPADPFGTFLRYLNDSLDPEDFESLEVKPDSLRDCPRHYHKKSTEIYWILHGEGFIELNGATKSLCPGTVVAIGAYTRHRIIPHSDRIDSISVSVPPRGPSDEFYD